MIAMTQQQIRLSTPVAALSARADSRAAGTPDGSLFC
jgi:hypothetical protein